VVVLLPRFQRGKEWAYAGMIFTYSGAVAAGLFVLAVLTMPKGLPPP
jgi:hypothetical protein